MDVYSILSSRGIVVVRQPDGTLVQRQLTVSETGELGTREMNAAPIDQTGRPERIPIEQRWAGTDQAGLV